MFYIIYLLSFFKNRFIFWFNVNTIGIIGAGIGIGVLFGVLFIYFFTFDIDIILYLNAEKKSMVESIKIIENIDDKDQIIEKNIFYDLKNFLWNYKLQIIGSVIIVGSIIIFFNNYSIEDNMESTDSIDFISMEEFISSSDSNTTILRNWKDFGASRPGEMYNFLEKRLDNLLPLSEADKFRNLPTNLNYAMAYVNDEFDFLNDSDISVSSHDDFDLNKVIELYCLSDEDLKTFMEDALAYGRPHGEK